MDSDLPAQTFCIPDFEGVVFTCQGTRYKGWQTAWNFLKAKKQPPQLYIIYHCQICHGTHIMDRPGAKERMCTEKRKHTEKTAYHAMRVHAKDGELMLSYRCPVCGYLHLSRYI